MFNKFIRSISSDLDDPAYPQRILQEYMDFFHLERVHIAKVDEEGHTHFYESIGIEEFADMYTKYEMYDVWKPSYMPVPQQTISIAIDIQEYCYLASINPLYGNIEKTIKKACLISSIHPTCIGLCGFRQHKDYSKEELQRHQIITPLINNCYHQHKKMLKTRDTALFLVNIMFQNRLCTVLDEHGVVMYRHPDFMTELRLRGLDWKVLKKQASQLSRPDLMYIHSLNDRITLSAGSGSTALTLEPVVSSGRLYCVIEIHDRPAFPSITPREREVHYLLQQGCTNSDIAHALNISPETVKRHLSNLFAKTGARNRTELSHLVL